MLIVLAIAALGSAAVGAAHGEANDPLATSAAAVKPLATTPAAFRVAPDGPTDAIEESIRADAPTAQPPRRSERSLSDLLAARPIENPAARTLMKQSFDLAGGGELTKVGLSPLNVPAASGGMRPIRISLKADRAATVRTRRSLGRRARAVAPRGEPLAFRARGGSFEVRFGTIGAGDLKVVVGRRSFRLHPQTGRLTRPQIERDRGGKEFVVYRDAWAGVDLLYEYTGVTLKEHIRVRHGRATNFGFRVSGTAVKRARGGGLALRAPFQRFRLGALAVSLNRRGPVPGGGARYVVGRGGHSLAIRISDAWVRRLKPTDYPFVIDPPIEDHSRIPGGNTGEFRPYKSDGYACSPHVCNVNVGALNDAGRHKAWRTMMRLPFGHIAGRQLLHAALDLHMGGGGWLGYFAPRTVWVTWAPCFGYHCTNGGAPHVAASIGTDGSVDVTPVLQWLADRGEWGGWLIAWGEEWHTGSYKQFLPEWTLLRTYTNRPPGRPSPVAPSRNADVESVVTTTTPQLAIDPASDPDGDALTYNLSVKTRSGVVVWQSLYHPSRQHIIPDGVLQDGQSYTWDASVSDGAYPAQSHRMGAFRVDLRTGLDKTQTFDDFGVADVSLNTGNLVTSVASHDIKARGGSIGIELTYNTPQMGRPGLLAEYFNDPNPTGSPNYRRVEPNIDSNYDLSSPVAGFIRDDHFSARWTGFFVAPETGSYTFGVAKDDDMTVDVDGRRILAAACCSDHWADEGVQLKAGQAVPILVTFRDYTGPSRASLRVRGAVAEQVVKPEWLRTPPLPTARTNGLTGRYFEYDGDQPPDVSKLASPFLVRTDETVQFDYGAQAPSPGAPADRFAISWDGFFTAPATGAYRFGVASDDGARLWVNRDLVVDAWVPRGITENLGREITLEAGQTIPIRLDYFEQGGPGAVRLIMDGVAGRGVIESKHLTPGGRILPPGMSLSADADGDLAYHAVAVRANGDVVAFDADGFEHRFTFADGGFKPPADEDAFLVRNADGTHTITDGDGRTYVFNVDGSLRETGVPEDGRNPASLKYRYASHNGVPKLREITDGVTASRWGKLHYGGEEECKAPAGFDPAPAGVLCAFTTYDGRATSFLYRGQHLVRVEAPGGMAYDLGYDENGVLVAVRDVVANQAVAAGVRSDDASVRSEFRYDRLGRVNAAVPIAGNSGDPRPVHSNEYRPTSTLRHVEGVPEPVGYLQRISFDSKLRTTEDCDRRGQCSATEWDPDRDLVLSTTSPRGQRSTTIYDEEDRPVAKYGPAPASWFGTDRRPLATHVQRVPRSDTGYDEGVKGLAAAHFDYRKTPGATTGMLFGAPRELAIGVPGRSDGALKHRWGAKGPIAPSTGAQGWGTSYTGRIRLRAEGAYRIKVRSDDGARVYVDDALVVDDFKDGAVRDHPVATVQNSVPTGSPDGRLRRIRVDHYDVGGDDAEIELSIAPPGGDFSSDVGDLLTPAYGLQTSTRVHDPQLGDLRTATRYSNPALGLVAETVADAGGLDLTAKAQYEVPGEGLLRQTGRTTPGGSQVRYVHWGAAEKADDPCEPGEQLIPQAGFTKSRIDADPDGEGPRSARRTDTVYDASGATRATRVGDEPWTCFRYNAAGELAVIEVPTVGNRPGRRVENFSAWEGNPLVDATRDESGLVLVETDLSGDVVRYVDAKGNTTVSTQDELGRLASREGPLGKETFTYDAVDQLTSMALNGETVATISYDDFGRATAVRIPSIPDFKLSLDHWDELDRQTGQRISLPARENQPAEIVEQIERSLSGSVTKRSLNGVSLSGGDPTYRYDGARRLVGARLAGNDLTWGFGPQTDQCAARASWSNAEAGRGGNRTTASVNGRPTWWCYDQADRLIASSDASVDGAEYDSHGNTIKLGATTFAYDNSDRNVQIVAGGVRVRYVRDAQGRPLEHIVTRSSEASLPGRDSEPELGSTSSRKESTIYGYTGSGDSPDFLRNSAGEITERYFSLPGGLTLTKRVAESEAKRTRISLHDLHGDLLTTLDGNGAMERGVQLFDPFGLRLKPTEAFLDAHPTLRTLLDASEDVADSRGNTAEDGYLGVHHRFTETAVSDLQPIQMGARTYVPRLGRFLPLDPVEGGVDNDYVWPNDPVNQSDVDGKLVPLVIGAVTLGMSAWSAHDTYKAARSGDKKGAGIAAVGIIPFAPTKVTKAKPLFGWAKGKLKSVGQTFFSRRNNPLIGSGNPDKNRLSGLLNGGFNKRMKKLMPNFPQSFLRIGYHLDQKNKQTKFRIVIGNDSWNRNRRFLKCSPHFWFARGKKFTCPG
jgi:RHS repeat-associated protein